MNIGVVYYLKVNIKMEKEMEKEKNIKYMGKSDLKVNFLMEKNGMVLGIDMILVNHMK